MIIKQRKCPACSFTFAIAGDVTEAICTRCGAPVPDPEAAAVAQSSLSVEGPVSSEDEAGFDAASLTPIPELRAPAPPAVDPKRPPPLSPAPSFATPETTPTSEKKPALGRIALQKKALPRTNVSPQAPEQKKSKKSRYDDSAIRGKLADISASAPPPREDAISIKEALGGEATPPLAPSGERKRSDEDESNYIARGGAPREEGDLVVEDEEVESVRPRSAAPPPPIPGTRESKFLEPKVAEWQPLPADLQQLPAAEESDWQPLPADFQPPPVADESETVGSSFALEHQSLPLDEEQDPLEPSSNLQPLDLDQSEPAGYEGRFQQAAVGASPADSLTPLPVFESATDGNKKVAAAGPGIKVVVPMMPVEEVQLGEKRPTPRKPAPSAPVATENHDQSSSAQACPGGAPPGSSIKNQGQDSITAAPSMESDAPETAGKQEKKRRKWWLFGLLGKSLL